MKASDIKISQLIELSLGIPPWIAALSTSERWAAH